MTRSADLDRQIGMALREARLVRGVTQEELAQALGVNRTTIARYESGLRSLPVSVLPRLVTLLAVPITDLVPGPAATMGTPPPLKLRSPEHAALERLVRVLEQHPDLLPAVLESVETLLQRAGRPLFVGDKTPDEA